MDIHVCICVLKMTLRNLSTPYILCFFSQTTIILYIAIDEEKYLDSLCVQEYDFNVLFDTTVGARESKPGRPRLSRT